MFVNTQGRSDTHIPADLQMEYLVKLIKKKNIRHMFSNKTEDNISKGTKSLSGIETISDVYDLESNVIKRSKHHKNKDADSD
jgi:myosin-crossreactive antigen